MTQNILEVHNGVYEEKWNIISSEGFLLPEGLEYLKKNSKKYPSIKCSNMSFVEILKGLDNLPKNIRLSSLELINCYK